MVGTVVVAAAEAKLGWRVGRGEHAIPVPFFFRAGQFVESGVALCAGTREKGAAHLDAFQGS